MKSNNIILSLVVVIIIIIIFAYWQQTEEQIDMAEKSTASIESVGSGFLVVETFPSDADVFMDDVYEGKSAITLNNVPAGSHNIVIKKEGYENSISEIIIEAGKKTFLEVDLILIPIFEEEPEIIEVIEEEIVEEKEEALTDLKGSDVVDIGKGIILYYDFSEGEFTNIRKPESDIFSKRYSKHIIFTRIHPVNIKTIDKSIGDVEKEDCVGIKGQFEYLYSGQSLCVITKENQIAALGGKWETTLNAKLSWKLFN